MYWDATISQTMVKYSVKKQSFWGKKVNFHSYLCTTELIWTES